MAPVSLSLMRWTATSPGERLAVEVDWRTVSRPSRRRMRSPRADVAGCAGEAVAAAGADFAFKKAPLRRASRIASRNLAGMFSCWRDRGIGRIREARAGQVGRWHAGRIRFALKDAESYPAGQGIPSVFIEIRGGRQFLGRFAVGKRGKPRSAKDAKEDREGKIGVGFLRGRRC